MKRSSLNRPYIYKKMYEAVQDLIDNSVSKKIDYFTKKYYINNTWRTNKEISDTRKHWISEAYKKSWDKLNINCLANAHRLKAIYKKNLGLELYLVEQNE